jgi:two-component system, NtrC family, sensor kinase
MLQHSRAVSGKSQLTDINSLAEEYLHIFYHGLPAIDENLFVKLVTDFDQSISKVNIVPQDIGRVLLNMLNNSLYALRRKLHHSGQYEPEIRISTKAFGDRIEIRLRDNGTGIPESINDKIFQPFFTTKPTGQGTGLGLSLSYEIITKGHRGEIKVETKEGEFTEFIIILPVA